MAYGPKQLSRPPLICYVRDLLVFKAGYGLVERGNHHIQVYLSFIQKVAVMLYFDSKQVTLNTINGVV